MPAKAAKDLLILVKLSRITRHAPRDALDTTGNTMLSGTYRRIRDGSRGVSCGSLRVVAEVSTM